MTARVRKPAAGRAGISAGAVLVVLQFAVVAVMLVMGQVDWQRTMATATPQPVGSAEASQGPADYATDVAGEVLRSVTRPAVAVPEASAPGPAPVEPVALSVAPVAVERVAAVGTAAAVAASATVTRPVPAEPLAVVAADAAATMPLRAVRLDAPADAGPVATQDRSVAVDQSGIPLPPPAD